MVVLSCHNLYAQTSFDVSSVSVCISSDKYADFDDIPYVGRNKKGLQLWYSTTNAPYSEFPYIKLDSYYLYWSNPSRDGHYGYDCSGSTIHSVKHGVTGENVLHFFLVAGRAHALYGGYRKDQEKWEYITPGAEFTLAAKMTLSANEPVFDKESGVYKQTVKWNAANLSDIVLSEIKIRASYDGGNTWETFSQSSTKACDSTTITLPWTASRVRYEVVETPKDDFKMLIEDDSDLTSEPTQDFELKPVDIPCEFAVWGNKTNLHDAEDIDDRTYSPSVEWKIPDSYAEVLNRAELQYSLLNEDDEWHTLMVTDQTSGEQKVTVPVGITKFCFRMILKPKAGLKQFCDSSIVSGVQRSISYFSSSAYRSLAIKGALSDSYDSLTETLNPTLAYELSDDQFDTRVGHAGISYSTDGGTTWTLLTTTDVTTQNGEVKLTVPAEEKDYLFRMGMASRVDNVITANRSQDTKAYTFTKPVPVPTITLDDSKTYEPQSQTTCNVKVMRSFVSGRMGTVCLPFDLTAKQIAEGFGENAEVYDYTSLNGSTMNFSKATRMTAGKPYLVKTAENKDYLYFSDVTISSDTQAKPSTIDESYVFTGTFSPYSMATDKSELFLSTDGLLKYPSSSDNNRIGGYRGYFRLAGGGSVAQSAQISFDGSITGISSIDIGAQQSPKIYNLKGQYVGDNLKNLPKGIYMSNGKKIVIDTP